VFDYVDNVFYVAKMWANGQAGHIMHDIEDVDIQNRAFVLAVYATWYLRSVTLFFVLVKKIQILQSRQSQVSKRRHGMKKKRAPAFDRQLNRCSEPSEATATAPTNLRVVWRYSIVRILPHG
jgi:hypothetical protein